MSNNVASALTAYSAETRATYLGTTGPLCIFPRTEVYSTDYARYMAKLASARYKRPEYGVIVKSIRLLMLNVNISVIYEKPAGRPLTQSEMDIT